MDDSTIISDHEIIESYDEKIKIIPSNFHEKKVSFKVFIKFLYFTCIFINYYSTIDNLITVSIYCYLIKYSVKSLLPFHNTNNKLNKFYIDSINWKWVLSIKTLKPHILLF